MTEPAFPPDALRLRNLRKSFGKPAVDGLDLTIQPGEFYALLGANGAGKTTTLRMVAGLLQPDSGEVSICGIDARKNPLEAKAITAWLPDEPLLYDKLAPLEYLEFVSGLWGLDSAEAAARAEDLLRRLGLWEQRNQRCEGFSRGMRQKVALAGALIHAPRLLMLDEPLTGLDAGAARLVKDMLAEQTRQGVAVVLTTHILEVAEKLADRIGIIADGKLIAEGDLAQLRRLSAQYNAGRGASLEDVFLDLTARVVAA
jgi:ABC-2 type transport system ATP-binding protein